MKPSTFDRQREIARLQHLGRRADLLPGEYAEIAGALHGILWAAGIDKTAPSKSVEVVANMRLGTGRKP
jgi:hypothetical protein